MAPEGEDTPNDASGKTEIVWDIKLPPGETLIKKLLM
jgi:hypothetical protein